MPIFSSLRETLKPGTVSPFSSRRSTTSRLIPSCAFEGSVLTTRTMKSARGAVGDEHLRAVDDEFVAVADRLVRMLATSEPTSGSVIPRQPILSPAIAGGR